MPRENPFLGRLASFLCILIKATCVGLKSYFSAKISLNTAQSFSTTRKTVVKKAAIKPLEGLFFLIHCKLNLLFCSVLIHELERVNEFLRLSSHVKLK